MAELRGLGFYTLSFGFSKRLLESQGRRLWVFLSKESGVKIIIRTYCSSTTYQAQGSRLYVPTTLRKDPVSHSHFKDAETESQQDEHMPKVTKPLNASQTPILFCIPRVSK